MSISADGSTIVFSSDRRGARQSYRLAAATGRAEPIPGVPTGKISPDGKRVAYRRVNRDIMVQSLDGGPPTKVAHVANARNVDYWLDDDHLLVEDQEGLLSVPVGGGAPVRIALHDSTSIYDNAAPLPQGDGILFNIFAFGDSFDVDSARGGIAAVGLHGGTPVRLTRGRFARFAPPNHLIVNRPDDGTIVAFPFDPKHFRITGPAVPIVTGLPLGGYSEIGMFDVAASGRLVYLDGDNSRRAEQIVRVDRKGVATPIGTITGELQSMIAVSPDGTRIAAIVVTPTAYRIQVIDLATGAVALINSTAQFHSLAWASDGRSLFYLAVSPANTTIYRAVPGTVGTPEPVLSMPRDSSVLDPMPSTDGRVLYFTQFTQSSASFDIRSLPLDGHGKAHLVVGSPARWPIPSPDGRWLAYHTGGPRSGVDTLVVRSTDPARSEVWPVASGADASTASARWSRDGKSLYFIARDSMRVATVAPGADFRIVSTQTLFPRGNLASGFDVTSDGQFVMVRPLPGSEPVLHLMMLENWASMSR